MSDFFLTSPNFEPEPQGKPVQPVQGLLFATYTDKRQSLSDRFKTPTLMDWLDANPAK